MEALRRFDERLARVEGAIAVAVLLGMVLVASAQALFFNIADRGVGWARTVLDNMSWADVFLQKCTLWVAFLGASLATHKDKHIGIDLLPRLAAPRVGAIVRAVGCVGAGLIAFVLARVFFEACVIADQAIPFDYERLTPAGSVHVCDAPAEAVGPGGRPSVLCAMRSALGVVGVPVSTGEGIAQMIAPFMFVAIGIRLLARAAGIGLALARGETPEPSHAIPNEPPEVDR